MANINLEDYTKYINEDTISTYPTPTIPTGVGTLGSPTPAWTTWTPLSRVVDRRKIVSEIVEEGYWIKMTGSRVTKDGWTSESDWDYVIYDPDHKLYNNLMETKNWHLGGSGRGEEFVSLKQGDTNLILVDKEEVWKKYIIATNLIKTLNSKTKGERIAVFDSVFGKDSNAKAVEF